MQLDALFSGNGNTVSPSKMPDKDCSQLSPLDKVLCSYIKRDYYLSMEYSVIQKNSSVEHENSRNELKDTLNELTDILHESRRSFNKKERR